MRKAISVPLLSLLTLAAYGQGNDLDKGQVNYHPDKRKS